MFAHQARAAPAAMTGHDRGANDNADRQPPGGTIMGVIAGAYDSTNAWPINGNRPVSAISDRPG